MILLLVQRGHTGESALPPHCELAVPSWRSQTAWTNNLIRTLLAASSQTRRSFLSVYPPPHPISPYLLLEKPKQLADHFFSTQVHIPLWLGSCPGPNCSRLKEQLQAANLVAIVPAEALYVSQDSANSKTQRDNCGCSLVPLEFQLSSMLL